MKFEELVRQSFISIFYILKPYLSRLESPKPEYVKKEMV